MPNQEHFWPNLKAFAENNRVANLETLGLECVVCRDSFHYRGLSDDETTFCDTRCPICRTELVHDCGHAHTGMPLPLTPGNMDKLPPILSQGGGMPRGCGPCGILGLQRLFEQELNNSPYIPEELKGEYLGIGIMLYSSDEYCSREVTGPVLEIEAPTSIKHMISEIVAYAVRSQRRNQVWLEADFSSMRIRALHFKPDILSRVEESPVDQETAPNNEN
ncbi:unnamed protein product [Fusarium fujikuroi]|nr:hypothetical protein CEK25_003939 [Fusarium fujikuroi]VZI17246.1 unnamed protein product [Fusarium fujikuroi]